jgi:glycosyltransferase involved in cell wall biosynthesis
MTRNNPTVSIILPTYNRAAFIGRSIETILSQTFRDFEIIIIDDGSTDNTAEIVTSMLGDNRIIYERYVGNRGAPCARNIGIRRSSGRYVTFQDSDDTWTRDKLMKQVRAMEEATQDTGVVYTGYYRLEGSRKIYMPVPTSDYAKASEAISRLFYLFVATPTALIRKECLEAVGLFDETLPRLQEWELWIRMCQRYRFQYINEALVMSHHQAESISTNHQALITAFELILQKHRQILEGDKGRLADLYAIFGRHLLTSPKTFLEGKNYLRAAVRMRPMKVQYILLVLFSALGFRQSNMIRELYRSVRQ